MTYKLKVNYADKSNYGGSRSTSKIKYIVIHYTANDGDTDEANAKYFKRKNIKASAHYFVDDDSVTISVPDTIVAWSVGGSRYKNYKSTGGAKYYKKCTNTNSISIEMCDATKDGKIMASEKTMQNTAELVKTLMAKYNVPIENVIRHFDVTGKACPAYFVDQNAWNGFKARLGGSAVETPKEETHKTDLSGQKAINYAVQVWINEYLGGKYLVTDGLFGKQSKKHLNMCLEKALGLSMNGSLSSVELNRITYSKVKNSVALTKVLEAYLYARGFNPQEFSGKYTDSVKLAVKEFQRTVFTLARDIDGLAGVGTFKKLVF